MIFRKLIFGISLILGFNAFTQQTDLSGKWELSYKMPDGKELLTLYVESTDTLAKATSSIGKFEIRIDHNQVAWSYPLNFRRGKELATFNGVIKNSDYLKGVLLVHHGIYSGRAVKWRAHRISKDSEIE
ncbi:hypothetical protein [Ekhidna sp.]